MIFFETMIDAFIVFILICMIWMFTLIIAFFIIKNAENSTFSVNNLKSFLIAHFFTNIDDNTFDLKYRYIVADYKGDNYLFIVKKDNTKTQINYDDIKIFKAMSRDLHIHNVILYDDEKNLINGMKEKLENEKIKIWNSKMIEDFESESRKIDDSLMADKEIYKMEHNDNCKIDDFSVDPIQDGETKTKSVFSNLFEKPDKL